MANPTSPQVIFDLLGAALKLLAREAVQRQLLVGIVLVLVAWGIAAFLVRALDAFYRGWLQKALMRQFAEQGIPETDAQAEEQGQLQGRKKVIESLYEIARQLVFPITAILLVWGAETIFRSQDWYSGLLVKIQQILFVFLLYRLIIGLLYAFGNREKIEHYQKRLFNPLFITILALLIIGTVQDLGQLGAVGLFPLFDSTITLSGLFLATIGFYFWFVATGALKDLLQFLFTVGKTGDDGSVQAGLTLLRYGLIALGLFVLFQVLGLDATTVAAITGGLSIGVGFALQDVLKNFLGGIILLFEGTVRPGDWVDIGGTEGEVESLSIRSTVVKTFDNVEYIVPNQNWLNSVVTTFTRSSRRVRTRIPIGVSYDSDVRQVQKILIDTALSHPLVLKDPAPGAALVNFGDSSVDFIVLVWVDDAKIKGKVAGDLRFMIWDAFKENGIEIPYPQRDLHIRSGLDALQPASVAVVSGNGGASI